jgi:hypothetical protein
MLSGVRISRRPRTGLCVYTGLCVLSGVCVSRRGLSLYVSVLCCIMLYAVSALSGVHGVRGAYKQEVIGVMLYAPYHEVLSCILVIGLVLYALLVCVSCIHRSSGLRA